MIFNRQSSGFSLLEVLVSLTVIAIGILGFMKMQVYFERKSEVAAKGLIALQIAESQLESVKGVSFHDISGAASTISRAGTTYHWQQTVRSKTIGNAGDAKQVEVQVRWQDRWDQAQEVSLVTLQTLY